MKARILCSETEVRKLLDIEFKKKYQEVFDEIYIDVASQTLANVFMTLVKSYGFGKKRLIEFLENLKSNCDIMNGCGFCINKVTTDDNLAYLKDKYALDLKKEFEFEISKEY